MLKQTLVVVCWTGVKKAHTILSTFLPHKRTHGQSVRLVLLEDKYGLCISASSGYLCGLHSKESTVLRGHAAVIVVEDFYSYVTESTAACSDAVCEILVEKEPSISKHVEDDVVPVCNVAHDGNGSSLPSSPIYPTLNRCTSRHRLRFEFVP